MSILGDPLGLTGSLIDLGGRAYVVRPPVLREVLVANAALAAAGAGLEDADELLTDAVLGWLPLSMRSVLLSPSVSREGRYRLVVECLSVGIDSPQAKADEAKTKDKAKEVGWSALIGMYRARYHPADVLAEPWPFFSAQAAELTRLKARHQVEQIGWYAAARTGGESLMRIYREADLYEPPEAPAHLIGEAGEEWAKQKRAQTEAYRERRREKLKRQAERRRN